MLKGARIPAEWVNPPSAADIRAADSERMLGALLAPVEIDEADRALAARLLAERSPEEIAAALIQAHRAKLPQPEELLATDAPPPSGPRPGFEGSAWFRLNVGRRQNADARWILPLLCRRGHVSRTDIGAIRLAQSETLFEIAGPAAARFLEAVRRTAEDDDGVEITPVDGAPRDEARAARREHRPSNDRTGPGKPPHRAKPAPHRGQPGPRAEGGAGGPKPFHKKAPWKGRKPQG
jgi:ATP-dependent RNA helicase DeaD